MVDSSGFGTRTADKQVAEPAARRWYAVHTAFGAEASVANELEASLGAEVLLPARQPQKGREQSAARELLFHNYIFLRAGLTDSLVDSVLRLQAVRGFVGAVPGRPSAIPEWEISFIKYLAALPRHPLLGKIPTQGADVEIVGGALAGVRGKVVSIRNQHARIAVTLSHAGGAFEVVVPLSQVATRGPVSMGFGEERRRSHRGGKRMKRHLRSIGAD